MRVHLGQILCSEFIAFSFELKLAKDASYTVIEFFKMLSVSMDSSENRYPGLIHHV